MRWRQRQRFGDDLYLHVLVQLAYPVIGIFDGLSHELDVLLLLQEHGSDILSPKRSDIECFILCENLYDIP